MKIGGFPYHQLRELYDTDLSFVATRDLLEELESRLHRRAPGDPPQGTTDISILSKARWNTLSVVQLKQLKAHIESELNPAAGTRKEDLKGKLKRLEPFVEKFPNGWSNDAAAAVAARKKKNQGSPVGAAGKGATPTPTPPNASPSPSPNQNTPVRP